MIELGKGGVREVEAPQADEKDAGGLLGEAADKSKKDKLTQT